MENVLINNSYISEVFNNRRACTGDFEELLRFISLKDNDSIDEKNFLSFHWSGWNFFDSSLYKTDSELTINSVRRISSEEKASFVSHFLDKGWTRLNTAPYPVSQFLSKYAFSEVFINTEEKKATILVEGSISSVIYAISSSLFRILPWRFSEELTADEVRIFKSFVSDNSEDITFRNNYFNTFANNFIEKARSFVIHKKLDNWENLNVESIIRRLKSEEADIERNIKSYMRELSNFINRRDDAKQKLSYYSSLNNEKTSEFANFFESHKQLQILDICNINDRKIVTYSIDEVLEFYDVDEFTQLYNNPNSWFNSWSFYNDTEDSYDNKLTETIKTFLYSVFAEQKGKIHTNCAFNMTNLCDIEPRRQVGSWSANSFPHPHLYYYGCLGGNEGYICEYLSRGDWDLAIEQTIVAAKNLNFSDSTVITRFMQTLCTFYTSDCKFIETNDGEMLSIKEFLNLIGKGEEVNE